MDALFWDDVRYFLALGRQGSLSATARFLGVEHSTVARRVSQLEESLAVKLFDRLARGWVLTREGEQLFEQAILLEERILAFQRTAHAQTALSGSVRISAPPVFVYALLMPHLTQFQQEHPELELTLLGEQRLSDISRAEADIAIRIAEPDEADLIARRLGEITYGLYGRPQCVQAPPEKQVFIGFDENFPGLSHKAWLERHVGTRRYALRTNDFTLMYRAALLGWGIAMLPTLLIRAEDGLQAVANVTAPSRTMYLVMHPDVRRAPRVRLAADFLIQICQRYFAEAT